MEGLAVVQKRCKSCKPLELCDKHAKDNEHLKKELMRRAFNKAIGEEDEAS